MGVQDTLYENFLNMIPDEMPQKYLALTMKESQYISKAESIVSTLNQKFIVIDANGDKMLSLPENYHELLASEMLKKRLSIKKAEQITNKAFSGKWYTIILAGDKEPESGILSFYLVHDSTEGKGIYLDDNSPYYSMFEQPFSSAEEYCLKERELLRLAPDYKFIYSTEYFNLLKFIRIQKLQDSQGTIEGKWKLKSSPMLIMPVKIGRSAMNNAVDGIRADKGRKNISIGKYGCSYNPNKASLAFLKGNINAQKLLDLIQHEAYLTGYKTSRLKISMRKILEIRGLKDMRELKKQITSASALLDDMNFTGQLGNGDYDKLAITQGDTSIVQGYLYVNINEKFLEGLRNSRQEMLYNPVLQKLPSIGFSYGFARLFEEHKRRNAGQPNENRLAVSTLLESAPYPIYSELQDQGQAGQKIIEPFLKCFDKIEELGIFTYSLCKRGGEHLTEEEMTKCLTDYELFSSLLVEVEYFKETEPDYSRLIDLKAKANGKGYGSGRKTAQSDQKKPARKKERFRLQKN